MKRERVDRLLVERGLAPTRTRAQALVMAGRVLAGERRVEKPSETFPPDAPLRVRGGDDPAARYVGRGGLKLEKALAEFQIDPAGSTASTWAPRPAASPTACSSTARAASSPSTWGTTRLDWRLRTDPRVEVREGVNARHLKPEEFAERFDLAVMDVSFISATKVLPAIVPLLNPGGRVVLLIKPQFEVGKGEVGKGGIVRDPAQHARVVEEVNAAARALGLNVLGVTDSPITGADGNREFLALYEKQ